MRGRDYREARRAVRGLGWLGCFVPFLLLAVLAVVLMENGHPWLWELLLSLVGHPAK